MSRTKMLTRDEAEIALDEWEVVYEEIVDQGRWDTSFWVVLKDPDGQCWGVSYSCGSTEMQEHDPWEFVDHVEFTAVELRKVTMDKWCEIEREDV